MSENDILKVNTDQRLATLRFICNNNSHLSVDIEKCKNCGEKSCMYFCPADVYSFDEDNGMINVDYENCLECGTCRICCPYDAISWEYPEGSKGVSFRFG